MGESKVKRVENGAHILGEKHFRTGGELEHPVKGAKKEYWESNKRPKSLRPRRGHLLGSHSLSILLKLGHPQGTAAEQRGNCKLLKPTGQG